MISELIGFSVLCLIQKVAQTFKTNLNFEMSWFIWHQKKMSWFIWHQKNHYAVVSNNQLYEMRIEKYVVKFYGSMFAFYIKLVLFKPWFSDIWALSNMKMALHHKKNRWRIFAWSNSLQWLRCWRGDIKSWVHHWNNVMADMKVHYLVYNSIQ